MPYVNVWIDGDDLIDELEDDDLIEKLETRGYVCYKSGGSSGDGYSSVEHLLDCGMADAARAEALMIVSKIIGRTL